MQAAMALPVIPHPPHHPHQLELRACSMEPHGISSKLLQCKQGHDAYPESGAGTIKIQDGLARRLVLGHLSWPLSTSSCSPDLIKAWPTDNMDGRVAVVLHTPSWLLSCCPAVRLPCQSQCSSHEAVPVSSPSHPLCRHHGFPRTDSSQRPPLVSTSHLPMPG